MSSWLILRLTLSMTRSSHPGEDPGRSCVKVTEMEGALPITPYPALNPYTGILPACLSSSLCDHLVVKWGRA